MKLGTHELTEIPFPGDEHGYLQGSLGIPGDICGFFLVSIQVYRCTRCGEMFQPVGEDRYSVPEDPTTARYIRVTYGCTTRELVEADPIWECPGEHRS